MEKFRIKISNNAFFVTACGLDKNPDNCLGAFPDRRIQG